MTGISKRLRRASSLAVISAMLSASVAYASPASSTQTQTAAPSVVTSKTASGSSSSSTKTSNSRTPASTKSAIPVPVDKGTAEFRAELANKQKRLDEFQAQLDALDRQLEIAQEQHNQAVDQLEQTQHTVQTAQVDYDKAQSAYQIQTDILGDRAKDIYKNGSLSAVEILLDADSLSDLIARVKFLNTMGVRDADIAKSLAGQKQLLEQRVSELQGAQAAAESLEFELKARKIEVMLRIQERQQLLASAQQDLLKLLDSEAARRKAEESTLLAEVLAGANSKGISAAPGTPVETALAYHGIPYLWGGATPAAFDCSGLVLYVFKQHGVDLPHYSGSQFRLGEKVAPGDLQPGDVVFFGSPIHHVGIYIGGGYFIHAPRTGDFVKISVLADRTDFAGARRYPWKLRQGDPIGAVKTTTQALKAVP